MTQYKDINNFDPNKALFEQVRAVVGPIQTGDVTFDLPFTDALGNCIYGRWIYVGTSGNLGYVKWDGSEELLPNLAAGVWHPIFATEILSGGTTIAANQLRWGM